MTPVAAGIVVAAGVGRRLGAAGGGPKALVPVAGAPLLRHAVQALVAAGIAPLVVVHTPGHEAAFVEAVDGLPIAALVPGGATRTASVQAGLEALDGPDATPGSGRVAIHGSGRVAIHGSGRVAIHGSGRVAIHDAARAFVPPAVVRAAVDAVRGDVIAAAPGLPVADTLKRVVDDAGTVAATVDRAGLWAVQTPQVFDAVALATVRAWAGGREATDDLALVEQAVAAGVVSGRVRLVRGSPLALKVTYPDDLAVARALASQEERHG